MDFFERKLHSQPKNKTTTTTKQLDKNIPNKKDNVRIFGKQDAFSPAYKLNYFKDYTLDFTSRMSYGLCTAEKRCFENTEFEQAVGIAYYGREDDALPAMLSSYLPTTRNKFSYSIDQGTDGTSFNEPVFFSFYLVTLEQFSEELYRFRMGAYLIMNMHLIQVDSVQRWMEDLKLMTDCECMCILQSKPISIEKDEQNEHILSSQYSTCNNLQLLLKRAWIISTELTRIAQKLEKNRWQRVHSMTVRVNCHVRSMINEYNTFTRSSSEEMHQLEKLLINKCSEFTAFTERCVQTEDEQMLRSMKSCVNETLTTVAQYFGQLIELVLTHEAQNLLRQIDLSDSVYITESAINSLFSLTQEGAHLCRIIAKEGGVVALFKICRQDCFRCLYPQTLRTLASICCVEEGMHQLEKVDGILCLTDILTDNTHSEATHAEAAAVIAQITSPHLTFTQHLSSFLENMEEIVTALVKLCQEASSGEVFLLASAALANITFFDTMACEMLLQLNAMKILLAACSDKHIVDTPYSRDQVVTILANMSVLDQCASEIIQGNGIQLLMEMLFERSSSGNTAEVAACERVQQKSAVTLARLSRDPEVADAAVKLSCIPRLIKLCRSPTERNNSDSVLVACLAALRRLAVMSPDGLEDSDFQQLVKPRLVDSFLLCTNMEESFV
ncbi:protein inscuteable homolog isoform X1 [Cygnus atratus]|uniref:protein inscuteable homolog isoform X1 n=4 Tax=Cygnus atratus TaxID=8868 RepID=UPI0015D5DB22|nr:protein inscuteable homolog isoform X1 [Cygnus atratus]XP_035406251.1 protein inscuteable homolog isoform X1 [Cygnus atratus]